MSNMGTLMTRIAIGLTALFIYNGTQWELRNIGGFSRGDSFSKLL